MKQILLIVSLVLTVSGSVQPLAAPPDAAPSVGITLSRDRIAIGDSVAVRCTVTVPAGVTAGEPLPADEKPAIEFERRSAGEDTTSSGIVRKYDFIGYVVTPDSVRIGPFAVQYIAAGDTGRVLSNTLNFRITGFVKSAEDSLKPNRSPLRIHGGLLPLWLTLLAMLFLAGFLYWRKHRKRPAPEAEPERPFDEIGEFERIRALGLAESGRIKELYAEVSDAMRGFVHRNMGFEAMYSTTDEIRRKLRSWKDRETAAAIRAIFEESDMVKFARYTPAPERACSLVDRALVPIRKALADMAAEHERKRHAEEERHRSTAPAPESAPAGEEEAK